jgi:branched-chain amino acid transport system substrate-binding protein
VLRKTPPDRYVVNFRASYAEETAEMVHGLVTELGLAPKDLAFFTQNDAYGDAGYAGGIAALEKLGYAEAKRLPVGRYPRNTLDVEDALSRLLDPRMHPRAVIMVGAYKPCAKFIKLARQHGLDALFVNVSFVGSEALAAELGPAGDGVVVTQVVPLLDATQPVVKEFRAHVKPEAQNFVSLEGFAAARAFVHTLEAAGPQATRETFIDALEQGAPVDLGFGEAVRLSKADHQLSHAVWPTVIRAGHFQPLGSWRSLQGRAP